MKIQAPKGTKDVLPDESGRWLELEGLLRKVAGLYGYSEIRFPAFEHTELFLRSIGDTTDVVQKEMYTFQDKGGRSITLRPEGTASVVRSIVEHGLYSQAMPLKCFYIAPNFRHEKPQLGRLRQHHQFGVECFGASGPEADAEVISLADSFLKRLGLKAELTINSIGCPECRPAFQAALKEFLDGSRDKLCKTCLERLDRNPMRVLDCKNPDCAGLVKSAPVMPEFLCVRCGEHFDRVRRGLDNLGIAYTVDAHIVRGLDYYTRTVFEFLTPIEGQPRALCAGGRYDLLVRSLGGPDLPGLGFGSGLERLLLAMELQGVTSAEPPGSAVYIAPLDDGTRGIAARLCFELRSLGVNCETDICGRGLKAQMKYADKSGAQWAIVLGEDEAASGLVRVKNLRGLPELSCGLNAAAIAAAIGEKSGA